MLHILFHKQWNGNMRITNLRKNEIILILLGNYHLIPHIKSIATCTILLYKNGACHGQRQTALAWSTEKRRWLNNSSRVIYTLGKITNISRVVFFFPFSLLYQQKGIQQFFQDLVSRLCFYSHSFQTSPGSHLAIGIPESFLDFSICSPNPWCLYLFR